MTKSQRRTVIGSIEYINPNGMFVAPWTVQVFMKRLGLTDKYGNLNEVGKRFILAHYPRLTAAQRFGLSNGCQ